MSAVQELSLAEQVRRLVRDTILEPARAAGKRQVRVRAGDVQRELGWWNRVPSVCSALDSQQFQRMSGARLVDRRGPAQSTTAEWVFDLEARSSEGAPGAPLDTPPVNDPGGRRLVAVWDGTSFRPVVTLDGLEAGQHVVILVSPVRDIRDLAGPFAEFVGALSPEEADEMQQVMNEAFETISDEW